MAPPGQLLSMQRRDRKGVFINSSLLVERRVLLQQLQKKRDALLARLNELLEEQVCLC